MEQPTENKNSQSQEVQLEGGTYEIIRKRLETHGQELQNRIAKLNEGRKNAFGSIETKLLATERIATDNNCIPRDMVPVGRKFIFGYNVHMGLKSEVELKDVFSVYAWDDSTHSFQQLDLKILQDAKFQSDFKELYKYYKDTVFSKFAFIGPHLHMVFQVGKSVKDIKTFKWLLDGNSMSYIDNRSDHEFKFPTQHEFEWKRTTRDSQRGGKHPHISIKDRVFVETIGGDLTVKVEDNTETGQGIYAEPVEYSNQTLDDADIFYADLGNLILLKIKPYQEPQFRHFVFNAKLQEVQRIDSIEDSCILLPDNHGIVFSNGYYLDSGALKIFESDLSDMHFEKKLLAPNGEDFMYIFYNQVSGDYVLLSYNLIAQQVETPISCNGYSFFRNGELVYFKADHEPKRTHALQRWQTPYLHPDYEPPQGVKEESHLEKIGNKDLVRGMAEAQEVFNLIQRENIYASLYFDLSKKAGTVLDSYYWINDPNAENLGETLREIREAASAAIEEFEKVTRVKKSTRDQIEKVAQNATALMRDIDRRVFQEVDGFVEYLAKVRTARGQVISLKDLRYTNVDLIDELEGKLAEKNEKLSQKCVEFLLREDALAPYEQKVDARAEDMATIETVAEADRVAEAIEKIGEELELLIDIVSNLKIEDSTQTTQIIDRISEVYSRLNNLKAKLKAKRRDLLGTEAIAEFNAQLKLINQAVVNYLDVSETPDKCEEYLTKLMVQLEELEGKFADFDEFAVELASKRDEIYNAFETKKLALIEKRNKRATSLMSAADRILKGIKNRLAGFKEISEINGYFASDLMVDKVRDTIQKLIDMDDSVKADDVQSQLKTLKEDAIRQLKDRQDLFVGGENVIKLGKHQFSVNVQELDASIVMRQGKPYYHLSGTNFFEEVTDELLLQTQPVWEQSLVSENEHVYRAEYLAYQLLKEEGLGEAEDLQAFVKKFAAPRYQEGYVKGVHDQDAYLLTKELLMLQRQIGLLRFPPETRACAAVCWNAFLPEKEKALLEHRIQGLKVILQVFPDSKEFGELVEDLGNRIRECCQATELFDPSLAQDAGAYLFAQLTSNYSGFVISPEAHGLHKAFQQQLELKRLTSTFEDSLKKLSDAATERYALVRNWVRAFISASEATLPHHDNPKEYIEEVSAFLFLNNLDADNLIDVSSRLTIEGLSGEHSVITKGKYALDYNHFMVKMRDYEQRVVPLFEQYIEAKKNLVARFKKQVRLEEFKPRVLSSFVRNRLIDEVYLPMIGDNLAKQIGVVGEAKRTDLMGMLLLISPPGYGKTTLMEYVSSRLGLIFMKINGPAIGHQVTSLDPSEASNASAREEMEKLNLAFEMGDNVMIYLDDIQHCNPEFLQKFISLCDGQRKVEGVYKGESKTYDLRGKKVCVIMAGNPYTESGDKFQIPDMLANRADTYNLGDMLGDSQEAFEMSYIENSLTSNPVLGKLVSKSKKDLYTLIRLAKTNQREGIAFESDIAADELNEYISVLTKMIRAQQVILKVNQQYIASAAQSDEYRTEPQFKMQGSYRNMNKLAEKIVPIMNEEELTTLIVSHYEGEAQTLTSGAESNLLKFKQLVGLATTEEKQRWEDILKVFQKNQQLRGLGGNASQIAQLVDSLEAIKEVLKTGLRD